MASLCEVPVRLPTLTLTVMLNGIDAGPGVVNGQIEVREYLDMTAGIDHDIVNGAPAARVVQRLRELIEDAHGLPTWDDPT